MCGFSNIGGTVSLHISVPALLSLLSWFHGFMAGNSHRREKRSGNDFDRDFDRDFVRGFDRGTAGIIVKRMNAVYDR